MGKKNIILKLHKNEGKRSPETFILHNIYILLCSIVPTAFMATTVIFVSFSLVALYAQRRAYLFLLGKLIAKQADMKVSLIDTMLALGASLSPLSFQCSCEN